MLQRELVQFCFEISEAGRGVKLLWACTMSLLMDCAVAIWVFFFFSFDAVAKAFLIVPFQTLSKLSLGQLLVPPL